MQATVQPDRPRRRLVLVAAAMAVAMLIPGVVSAASSNFHAFTYAQAGNEYCGADMPELPRLAFVEITKKGPWLTVRTSFDGTPASANTAYDVFVFSASCNELGVLGTVTTNAYGVANVTLPKFKLPSGTTSLFIAIQDPSNNWNDTPIVP